MNLTDEDIEAEIWSCIAQSQNPTDFEAYLKHQPASAAHYSEAENRLESLRDLQTIADAYFPEVIGRIEQMAFTGDCTAQFHLAKFYFEGLGIEIDYSVAAHWFNLAAEQGEIRAAHNLANMKLAGRGIPQDVPEAIRLYEPGISAGDPAGAETLGSFFLEGEFKDSERGVAYLQKAYDLGSLTAGTRLGRFLYEVASTESQREHAKSVLTALVQQNHMPAAKTLAQIFAGGGHRLDRNFEAARTLYLKLLDSGHQQAMVSLGWVALQLPPESNSATTPPLYWFKRAWEAGLAEAAGYIGRAYLDGDTVEKSVDEALKWFMRGAENGEFTCAYFVGFIHDRGLDGDPSDKKAEPWYRKAAEAGSATSQVALARLLIRDNGIPINGTEATQWLNRAVSQGSTDAMLMLAHMYQDGVGVIKNEKAAFSYCLKAAESGDLVGQSEIGWRLCRGIGCELNPEEGVKWHKQAAAAGRAFDQGVLAYSYLYGQLSLEQDYAEAVKWAQVSATQNEDLGQFVLGVCYYFGCGLEKDIAKAVGWLTKAAEAGNVRAQAKLAEHYYCPEDETHRDLLLAGRWASMAADAGHPKAQLILGRMFLYGEQVESNPKAAVEWLTLAAEQDDSEAMYLLGILTADGVGTKRDWMIALKWLKKAADAGIDLAIKSLDSFGVTYVPGSENNHRLSPADPVILDSEFDLIQFEGRWEGRTNDAKLIYQISADGTFYSETDYGAAEPMTSEGRWAIRGNQFIWDVWKSNIPVEKAEFMDDQIAFVSQDELHLTSREGITLKFKKLPVTPDGGQKIIDLSLSALKKLWK